MDRFRKIHSNKPGELHVGRRPFPNKNKRSKAKQCALICVDEILNDDMQDMSEEKFNNRIEFWQNVKKEIEKL